MATPGNGPISLGDIRNEIGRGGPISFADGDVQDLLGSTVVLNLAQARGGKTYNFTVNTNGFGPFEYITSIAASAGWAGTGNITVVNNGTVTGPIYSGSNYWGDITFVNNGTVMGVAGSGGNGCSIIVDSNAFTANASGWQSGTYGGTGIYSFSPIFNRVQRTYHMYNNGTIAAGGGGGGGGCGQGQGFVGNCDAAGGGGGGGGQGIAYYSDGHGGTGGSASVIDGAGGAYPGGAGGDGWQYSNGPGGAGASDNYGKHAGDGGNGGTLGASGVAGSNNTAGWGYFGSGGGAGYAVDGYNNWTWHATGTIIGPIN